MRSFTRVHRIRHGVQMVFKPNACSLGGQAFMRNQSSQVVRSAHIPNQCGANIARSPYISGVAFSPQSVARPLFVLSAKEAGFTARYSKQSAGSTSQRASIRQTRWVYPSSSLKCPWWEHFTSTRSYRDYNPNPNPSPS